MIHSRNNYEKNQDPEPFGPQFWDKVVKTMFITGVSLILIVVALRWSGIIA